MASIKNIVYTKLYRLIKPVFIWLVFFSLSHENQASAQTSEAFVRDFRITQRDSIFLNKNSIGGYHLYSIDLFFKADSNDIFRRDILQQPVKGNVFGPYKTDSSINYVKIVSIDSAFKARVGNIWISEKRGKDKAMQTAYQILTDINNGSDYNTMCRLYSDDKNKKPDCDLGWFFNTMMVKEFGDEILKHKLGDVFIVETKFGYHVVKMLGEPYKDLERINYVILRLPVTSKD